MDERIQLAVSGLSRFPEMGRPGRVDGTREMLVQRTPYIAAYRIDGGVVRILRVLHGAQQWPEQFAATP